ncbi:MAG: hypothetical protein HYZ53_02330 [Planctomycetes bacterium]|nr:hypothetical protein [Planctomycetota bacterium]
MEVALEAGRLGQLDVVVRDETVASFGGLAGLKDRLFGPDEGPLLAAVRARLAAAP